MNLYSIILKEDEPVDPRAYGALLAPALGVPVIEAKLAVRRGGGILAENIGEENVRPILEKLTADGIGFWSVPSASLPPLRAPRRATGVETLPEGIRCTVLGQPEPVTLAWDRIGAVSIGLVLVPELQEEIAGVRRKDVAAIARLERDQRDLVRDRLLAFLARVDLSHEENAPPAAAHHYFFDQLRRREAMQLKAFADIVTADASDWIRIPLEDSGFEDRSGGEGAPAALNFNAVPVIYARTKEAHTERSRRLLQGGNVERLAFPTMEEFNRYTRWWTWRERLRLDPEAAAPAMSASPGGNGHLPKPVAAAPSRETVEAPKSRYRWVRSAVLAAALTLTVAMAVGLRFERRGADCMICRKQRQDDVVRLWGMPLKQTPGEWKAKGSAYDRLIGTDHVHIYNGFGYERTGLLGFGNWLGRTPGGNASPEEAEATECADALFTWYDLKEATLEEVRDAYPRLYDRVRTAGADDRKRWLDLSRARPDREAPGNLLKEISK